MLEYLEFGSGKPLVILHGLFGAKDNWLSIAKVLSDDWRVIVMDLRNHGDSFRSDEMSFGAMAEDVIRTCEHLGLSSVCLLGHSMGGKVAMMVALRHSEFVASLIVVDIAPVTYLPRHQRVFEALAAVHLELVHSRSDADQMMEAFLEDHALRLFLLKNLRRQDDGGYDWRFNLKAILACYDEISLWPNCGGCSYNGSTLFIRGDESPYIDSDGILAIHQYFSNVEVKGISGAGHWVHAQKPSEFMELVRDFLRP